MASKSEKYELFYSNSSVYSNFYPASFSDPDLMRRIPESSLFSRDEDFRFVHVEQYMHACKVGAIIVFILSKIKTPSKLSIRTTISGSFV